MPHNNEAAGVAALILLGLVVIFLAAYLFKLLTEPDEEHESVADKPDIDYTNETFILPQGAVESWPQPQEITRGTSKDHPFNISPSVQ